MQIFILFSILIYLTILIDSRLKYKYSKQLFLFWIIILFFVSAFRFQVGYDYINYAFTGKSISQFNNFGDILQFVLVQGTDIGYLVIGYLASYLFDNFQCIFIAMATVQSFLLYKSIIKYIKCKYRLICLYTFYASFYALSLTISRQMLAVLICLYAIQFIVEKKTIHFFVYVFIAVLFHKSAIVFLSAYFIDNFKVNIKYLIFYVFMLMFLSFGFKDILTFITNLLGLYNSYSFVSRDGALTGIIVSTVFLIPIIYTYIIYKEKIEYFDSIVFKLYLVGYILDLFRVQFFYFSRIALYYKIFFVIALLLPLKYLKIKENKLIISTVFTTLSIIMVNSSFSGVFLNENMIYKTNPVIKDLHIEWRDEFYEIQ